MANTTNLEFLGREGLKTLLDQVNLNTQSLTTAAKVNAGTYGGWIETGADPELDITFSNEFDAYIKTITDKNDRHYSRVVDVDFTRATITVETLANSGGEDSWDPITIPKGYYFICEKDDVFNGAKKDDYLVSTGSTTIVKQPALAYKEQTTTETISVTMPGGYLETPVLCYGNGRLVLLGHDADPSCAYYSDNNGQTWQEGTPVEGWWARKLVFGNGIFVGLTTDDKLLYSADGISWTIDFALTFSDIAFGDGKFIAIVSDSLSMSTNGINWTTTGSYSSFWGNKLAVGNGKIIAIDSTGTYWVFNLDGELINYSNVSMDPSDGINFINDHFVIYGTTGGIATIAISPDGLGDILNWQTSQITTDPFGIVDVLYVQGKYLAYVRDGSVYESVDNGASWSPSGWSELPSYTYTDNIVVGCTWNDLVVSTDGINWDRSANITHSKAFLEQAGTDVTSKVAKLVGGSGGSADLENATLENLTITGALTIDGDFTFGDLDATTVTAEKVVVSNDPVDDNDVATKKYVDEHSGSSGETYTVSVKTSGTTSGTYLKDSAGNEQKMLNLYDITTTSSESSITNGRNTSIGTGIKLSQVFGSGHTIGNNLSASLIRGQNHKIGADVNHVDVSGYKNTLADGADYNTIHGTEFNITGTHNVTFGVGGNCVINGKANMMAGDLTGSTITGNYNTILCGGGQNSITGTTADPCQHNVVLGSTTTLTSAENCLTLGRLNTINNHDRAALMGIGLTATRDNQLIVGSYNDATKTGGAFVVGNGSADWSIQDSYFAGQYITHSIFVETSYKNGDTLTIITSDGVVRDVLTFIDNGLDTIFTSKTGEALLSYGTPDLIISSDSSVHIENPLQCTVYKNLKPSNAMIVYKEGTVTIGHDPIGPMDVATKQYVDSHSSSGGVDEEQVRAIVEDVLLNGAW
jgi:hypothetical protein